MSSVELLAKLLDGAKAHGENACEPDHEVGDLHEILSSCWAEMSEEQRQRVYELHREIVDDNL